MCHCMSQRSSKPVHEASEMVTGCASCGCGLQLRYVTMKANPPTHTLHPIPHTLHPIPHTLHPTLCTLHEASQMVTGCAACGCGLQFRCVTMKANPPTHTLHPIPHTLHATRYTLHEASGMVTGCAACGCGLGG